MEEARHDLLADAGQAGDEDSAVGGSDTLDVLAKLGDGV